jgi:hypothetical protein
MLAQAVPYQIEPSGTIWTSWQGPLTATLLTSFPNWSIVRAALVSLGAVRSLSIRFADAAVIEAVSFIVN